MKRGGTGLYILDTCLTMIFVLLNRPTTRGIAEMETEGGSGGGSSQPQPTSWDVRLLERAIRESWDLPEDTRQAMVARLGTLISDPATKTRAFLAAAKTLTAPSRINLSVVDASMRAELAPEGSSYADRLLAE